MTKKAIHDMFIRTQHFFRDYTNFDNGSKGYGLTSDNTSSPKRASIAATGFMFCYLILATESHELTKDQSKQMTLKTIQTLLSIKHYQGFLPHFIDRDTGQIWQQSEYSTIDTMLMMMGLLAVDAYYDDQTISTLTHQLLSRIDWKAFQTTYQDKKVFAMAYNPKKHGDYSNGKPGYIFHWHMYAEQLMMYLLYPFDDAIELYDNIEKPEGSFKDITYTHAPGNTLFIYLFPLAFLDLKHYIDHRGFSIYDNAKQAILGHRKLSESLSHIYKTMNIHAFGFNASDTPKGYRVFHAIPNDHDTILTDGTIAPFSIVGSYPYFKELITPSLDYLMTIPGLYQNYGFMDAFNQEDDLWISDKIIAIDKGLEMLALDAAINQTIQKLVTNHPVIQAGMKRLHWKKVGKHGNN